MQLAISQNPYSKKPKELWDILNEGNKQFDTEMDQVGLDRLKERLSQNPRFVVK